MIKTNRGNTEMDGSAYELLADFSVIVHTLCYNLLVEQCEDTLDDAKRMIMERVERGLKSEEEIKRENDGMKHALNDLAEILRKAVEK